MRHILFAGAAALSLAACGHADVTPLGDQEYRLAFEHNVASTEFSRNATMQDAASDLCPEGFTRTREAYRTGFDVTIAMVWDIRCVEAAEPLPAFAPEE